MSKKRKPSYLLHKATGQARVRIDGKDEYLGEYGSPESRERYDDLLAEWFARQGDVSNYKLTVDDLALLFLSHAKTYYRYPNGEPTGEAVSIRHALRPLIELFGPIRVRDFGPRKLKRVRDELVRRQHCRTNINRMVERIKRMFVWGVGEEYLPADVADALSAVKGLRKGRTTAVESEPVEPVDEAVVNTTLSHLPKTLAAMVRLQLLTGARPGEICKLRPCDVTFGVDGVWRYTLEMHKTMWLGKQRRIHIGPLGQEILRPFLDRDPEAYCFSPADSEAQRNAERRENRESPMTPSHAARKRKTNRRRPPATRYTKDSFCRAIKRACEIAFAMPDDLRAISKSLPECERLRLQKAAAEWRAENCWTPGQLRHTKGTDIRKLYGIEGSQVVLGHSDPKTTLTYAEKNFALAAKIMKEIG